MSDVKAQEPSFDEWRELLEPYGWADITVTAPAVRFRVPSPLLEWEFRVLLKPGSGDEAGEWARRSDLLGQARKAVEAVQAKGYWLPDAPDIEFVGRYMYQMGDMDPEWIAGAELSFAVRPRP